MTVASYVWITGTGIMILYSVIQYIRLRGKLVGAIVYRGNVYRADYIDTPFVMGIFSPKIYLPSDVPMNERKYIIAHERHHIRRCDHTIKLLAYLALCIHWFNPLVWFGFRLMCRDIETACDEKVIRNLSLEQRKDYSIALLNSGKRMSGFFSCPVSFGEGNLKQRIKSVLHYRKPGLWITLSATLLAAVIAVCFMTNPKCIHEFDSAITSEATCLQAGTKTITCRVCNDSHTESIPAVDHRYDAGVVTMEASCTAEGRRTFTCIFCDKTKIEVIPRLAHEFDQGVETLSPTCSEQGILSCTCKICGEAKTQPIDMLEHTFAEKSVTREATCTAQGEISVHCILCGYCKSIETIPRSDKHDYQNQVIRKATCIDRGKGQKICTLCGHSTDFDYPLTDHSYGDAVVTRQATCTTQGERVYTCTVCSHSRTETIAETGHIWNKVDCNTVATCTVCSAKRQFNGHHYVYTKDRSSIGWVLEKRTGTCAFCGDTKNLIGSYDREALRTMGTSYAKKLGFITEPCAEHDTYSQIIRTPFVSELECNGRQEKLEQILLSMIDELDRRCDQNSQYYAQVVVEYPNPYGMGDGAYFRLVVYYHLCHQN